MPNTPYTPLRFHSCPIASMPTAPSYHGRHPIFHNPNTSFYTRVEAAGRYHRHHRYRFVVSYTRQYKRRWPLKMYYIYFRYNIEWNWKNHAPFAIMFFAHTHTTSPPNLYTLVYEPEIRDYIAQRHLCRLSWISAGSPGIYA